jgi:hypothetical protein
MSAWRTRGNNDADFSTATLAMLIAAGQAVRFSAIFLK